MLLAQCFECKFSFVKEYKFFSMEMQYILFQIQFNF